MTPQKWLGSRLICMQLALDGNDGKTVKGPVYYTQMHHVGEFAQLSGKWVFNESPRADKLREMSTMRGF